MNENEIGTIVVGTAISIHRHLGSGLLESVYETFWPMRYRSEALRLGDRSELP